MPSDIGDNITAYPANAVELSIVGELADTVPEAHLERLRKAAQLGAGDRGVRIVVEKQTPPMDASASLAAATLRAASRLTDTKLPPFPRNLEPDVAAAATVKSARVQGTMMSPLTLPSLFAVLIHAGHETPDVPEIGDADMPQISWQGAEETLNGLAALRNDAEPALREALPELEEVLDQLTLAPGCKFARPVGASATCLGMFPDRATAVGAAALLSDRYPAWWVAAAQLK